MKQSFVPALLLILAPVVTRGAAVDFSHQIVPILREHCGECHTGDKKKGGFSVNSRADLLKGGENGAVVDPGKSAKSKFIEVLITPEQRVQRRSYQVH